MGFKYISPAVRMTTMLLLLLLSLTGIATARDSDSAEELYDSGQSALEDNDYRAAARFFGRIHDEYPDADEAGDALYWRAFAFYRLDRVKYLKQATKALKIQIEDYPDAATSGDTEDLLIRIEGKLARHGDAAAHRFVLEEAHEDDEDGDEDIKIATLHALMNMNSKRAQPILLKILADRDQDDNSARLREQALFVLANNLDAGEAADILMDVARNDPDAGVRENAVFWLSNVPGEETVLLLKEILTDSRDKELREHAVFALSQHDTETAHAILRGLILDEDQSAEVREHAIFWLANEGDDEDIEYLMEIYARVDEKEMREQILFGVANSNSRDGARWLIKIVEDDDEDPEVRETALFFAGQSGYLSLEDLMKVYEKTNDREMQEQVLFVVGQQGDREALEWLITMARDEKDPKIREMAIFWISQFDDSEAEDFLIEIINGD